MSRLRPGHACPEAKLRDPRRLSRGSRPAAGGLSAQAVGRGRVCLAGNSRQELAVIPTEAGMSGVLAGLVEADGMDI